MAEQKDMCSPLPARALKSQLTSHPQEDAGTHPECQNQ